MSDDVVTTEMRADVRQSPTLVDLLGFRSVMRRLPTTVVIAGGLRDGAPVGMVVGTFTSVSLEPLLVGFLGDQKSYTLHVLLELGYLSFNVLDQDDADTANAFRKPIDQRFENIQWSASEFETPVLASSVMTFHTKLYSVSPAGDHQLVLGEVVAVEERHPLRRPLVYVEGGMTRLDPSQMASPHMWALGWD